MAKVQAEGQGQAIGNKQTKDALSEGLDKLAKYGSFAFLETVVDGVQNLNPERKARKNIFLTDEEKKVERTELKKRIDLWIGLLSSSDSISKMLEEAQSKAGAVSELLNRNLLTALAAVKNLERSYRAVQLFYNNTETDKLSNITIMNASPDQVGDLDNPRFIDRIADELKQNYDKLDLRNNYSILVIPGYLGSNKVLDKWSRLAYENKAMLFTDFADLDNPDDVVEMFHVANHTGNDVFKSNTTMACNWLIGRGKHEELGETDDLRVPPSAALAGKVYATLMSQVTAGKKFGGINEVDGVVFPLKKSEISQLEKMGLIPMVNEYGKVMAFSAKTLFSGDNLGLQTYSVVRVFDYVTKVLFDFLNRRSYENWNTKIERDLRGQIVKFLDNVQGPDRLIEKFKIMRLERDNNNKDRIYLDIHITPYFPAKSFVIRLDGTKGNNETSWDSEYAQA